MDDKIRQDTDGGDKHVNSNVGARTRCLVKSLANWAFAVCTAIVCTGWLLVLAGGLGLHSDRFNVKIDLVLSCWLMFVGSVIAPFGVICGSVVIVRLLMRRSRIRYVWLSLVGLVLCLSLVALCARVTVGWQRKQAPFRACQAHLAELANSVERYRESHGRYPECERWSDVLVSEMDAEAEALTCPSGSGGRSDYAMNELCTPDSPGDTVLLFESDAGWNAFGGPRLISFKHHPLYRPTANVLLNDMRVIPISPSDVNDLNWGTIP